MKYKIRFTATSNRQLELIENDHSLAGVLKQIRKTLGFLETNLKHQSWQTHDYTSLSRRYRMKVFEAYVQQNTPSAFRRKRIWEFPKEEVGGSGSRFMQ
jgi:hypothetical protein